MYKQTFFCKLFPFDDQLTNRMQSVASYMQTDYKRVFWLLHILMENCIQIDCKLITDCCRKLKADCLYKMIAILLPTVAYRRFIDWLQYFQIKFKSFLSTLADSCRRMQAIADWRFTDLIKIFLPTSTLSDRCRRLQTVAYWRQTFYRLITIFFTSDDCRLKSN